MRLEKELEDEKIRLKDAKILESKLRQAGGKFKETSINLQRELEEYQLTISRLLSAPGSNEVDCALRKEISNLKKQLAEATESAAYWQKQATVLANLGSAS